MDDLRHQDDDGDVNGSVATDSDDDATTVAGDDDDVDSDATTLVDQDGVTEDADEVCVRPVRPPRSRLSTASSGTPSRNSGTTDIVKVAVTVNGKSQLLELDQGLPLDEVCRGLCGDHGVRWRPGRYALAYPARPTRANPHASEKYLTEDNRAELRHGAELSLTWAPDVFAELIAKRLVRRTDHAEWSWALQRLAELSDDAMFVLVFAEQRGAVDLVLDAVSPVDKKSHKLRPTETLWLLRAVLGLVRHGALTGAEAGLSRLLRHLGALVRAVQGVEAAVVEASLRVLAAVSAQHWEASAAQHLAVTDLVPLLWDTDRPALQTAALELMNALAVREARLGRHSPEAKMQVIKTITSPQVCATIVQSVLAGHVRSNMARQLFLLQRLLLQPLKEALETPAAPALVDSCPSEPPPRLPRRKSRAGSLLHSRSWCEGEGEEGGGQRRGHGGRDRRSMEDDYKHLDTLSLPRPVNREPPEATVSSLSPTAAASTADLLDFRGSVTSLASMTSMTSLTSDTSHRSLWSVDTLDDDPPPPAQSRLGAECLEYLATYHPTLSVQAVEEEAALQGLLSVTAERLVRLLAAELGLCEDDRGRGPAMSASAPAASSKAAPPYQPLVFTRDVPFFHELFCRGLNRLARTRREMRAKTPRDQDKVLRVVRRQFREALGAQVRSWDQLDTWLSELPYAAVAALWEKERVSAEQDTVLGSAAVRQLRAASRAALRQLVRQQRVAALREGAVFQRPRRAAAKDKAGREKGSKRASQLLWVWLQGDATLQYADCVEEADGPRLLGAPLSIAMASVTSVATGRKCAGLWGSRSRKQGIELALSLLLDPHDCEAASLDLVAPDVATLEVWADGFNMLLGKEHTSKAVERDLEVLMDMEVRLRLMELDGISLPAEPPPVPPPPPDFDFVTA